MQQSGASRRAAGMASGSAPCPGAACRSTRDRNDTVDAERFAPSRVGSGGSVRGSASAPARKPPPRRTSVAIFRSQRLARTRSTPRSRPTRLAAKPAQPVAIRRHLRPSSTPFAGPKWRRYLLDFLQSRDVFVTTDSTVLVSRKNAQPPWSSARVPTFFSIIS